MLHDIANSPGAATSPAPVASVLKPPYDPPMPNDLYDRDVLAWSQHQADLLRRLARGERVNDLDWEHVAEEIEDVGLSELHAVESYLELIIVHLLKIQAWPGSDAVNHWQAEIVSFQSNAVRRFAPSMRQRISLADLYAPAVKHVTRLTGGQGAGLWPTECPFTLDQLLYEADAALVAQLKDASAEASAGGRE